MKKGKLALLLVVALFMVSGCGKEQTLSCTTEESTSGITMKSSIDVKFKGKKVDDMKVTIDVEYPEGTTAEQNELFSSTLKTQFESQGLKSEDLENGLRLTADKDSKFFEENDIDLDEKADYDEAKETFESMGYTCK